MSPAFSQDFPLDKDLQVTCIQLIFNGERLLILLFKDNVDAYLQSFYSFKIDVSTKIVLCFMSDWLCLCT